MSIEIEYGNLVSPTNSGSVRTWRRRTGAILLRSGSFIALALVLVVFSSASPLFATVGNIANAFGQSAILGVLAIGLTIVTIGGGTNVLRGGIDLSLAANMGLSAAVYATLAASGASDWTAVVAALGTGIAIGVANAISVTVLGIIPLLATLAVMNIVAGLELVLTQNTVVPASTEFLDALSGYGGGGIPILAYIFVGISVLFALLTRYSATGLRLYAVGSFPEAARASGLPATGLVAGSYVVSGLTGGIAGIISVAYLSGSTTGAGDMLLSVVAASLLGVVFSPRLVPTIEGTALAALFVSLLINGFQLLNISSYWVSGVEGALILLVVASTSIIQRDRGVS